MFNTAARAFEIERIYGEWYYCASHSEKFSYGSFRTIHRQSICQKWSPAVKWCRCCFRCNIFEIIYGISDRRFKKKIIGWLSISAYGQGHDASIGASILCEKDKTMLNSEKIKPVAIAIIKSECISKFVSQSISTSISRKFKILYHFGERVYGGSEAWLCLTNAA